VTFGVQRELLWVPSAYYVDACGYLVDKSGVDGGKREEILLRPGAGGAKPLS